MGFLTRAKSELPLRIYYASDIHATEVLWRKFLNAPRYYDARVLVMGGDIGGKTVIPIVEQNGGWTAPLYGRDEHAATEAELEQLENRIRGNGMYPYRAPPAELTRIAGLDEKQREAWFERVMVETFRKWMTMADERLEGSEVRCFVMPGNDDPPSLEQPIAEAKHVEGCDERVVEFDGYTMLSLGYSNRTPWNSPREIDEDELYDRIAELVKGVPNLSRCIFNLHVPPYNSRLDTAAELDDELRPVLVGKQPHMIPVGSTAVREAIERFQPLAALHGHIHESPGATRIGRTLCVNPGSDYASGRISGCLINLRGTKVTHQFVDG
jgi:Icc-related predicted phosphoesterase